MNLLYSIEKWGDTHHPKWLDFIRMLLGIFLFIRGVLFINNMDQLSALMTKSEFLGSMSLSVLAHYVVFAHIVGGALVAFGLLTRLACLVQIPVLLGAVFFINSDSGIISLNEGLWLSILVLALLIFFLVSGSGPISVDEQMRRQAESTGK